MVYSHADFLRISKQNQSLQFDYSQTKFVGVCKKVTVRCPQHGMFTQRAEHHMKGRAGCKRCASDLTTAHTRHTRAQFIERASGVHGSRYDYSKVPTGRLPFKVPIVCPNHGEFLQARQDHLAGKGCRGCAVARQKHGYRCSNWHGREIRYQGYELYAANYLVEHKGIAPEDIVFSMDPAGRTPVINWNGRKHYPDLWVPKENLIIEVKSTYTFERDRVRNLLKTYSARRAGYRYVILVMDDKGNRVAGYEPNQTKMKPVPGAGFRTKPAPILVL
jgi:hypothetical protein